MVHRDEVSNVTRCEPFFLLWPRRSLTDHSLD